MQGATGAQSYEFFAHACAVSVLSREHGRHGNSLTSINNNTEMLKAIPKFLFVFLREERLTSKDIDAIDQLVFSRCSFPIRCFLRLHTNLTRKDFGGLANRKT